MLETIKVVLKEPWKYDDRDFKKGEEVTIAKEFHDSLVAKYGPDTFAYPETKKKDLPV